MKKMKIYIVTYKRSDILNDTLEKLFASDFSSIPNTEVNIINNHSEFYLKPEYENKVNVLHNVLRPDWSNGNLAENWNQALINGFKSLNKPDCEYVVTLQNDTSVHPNWYSNLMKMHEKFNFVVGFCGDNLVSYTPEAVKNIGIWDENFFGVQYKEADYWIRALIFNKEKSCINDYAHGLVLNNEHALTLDTAVDRNIIFLEEQKSGHKVVKRKADDSEHQQIWSTRGGFYKEYAWKYFYEKWCGTWKLPPQKNGWIKYWTEDFKQSPPNIKRSHMKSVMKYPYFEKDIYDLRGKNYLVLGGV